MALISSWAPTLVNRSNAENLSGFHVSSQFFNVLDVKFERGRNFLPSEDVRGNNDVVILSHAFWQSHFAADPNLVGKPITLAARSYIVVGILSADFPSIFSFDPRKAADIYSPLAYNASLPYACRNCRHLRAIARLKDGTERQQAGVQMDHISQTLFDRYPTSYSAPGVILTPLKDYVDWMFSRCCTMRSEPDGRIATTILQVGQFQVS